ncbi:MAG: NifU family protein [Buchnera aphidicola (Eriosoma harunire)]
MIYISDEAQKYLLQLLIKEEKDTNIRIFINNVGSNLAEGKVAYCHKNDILSSDKVFYYTGFSVYINQRYLSYLYQATIDLVVDKLEQRLTLNAPYIKSSRNARDKSLYFLVEDFLESYINPKLLFHGGKVSLIKITSSGDVLIKFSGGCNGCSMVNQTLKEGVEKTLLSNFPNLNSVKDITEHDYGQHSFC